MHLCGAVRTVGVFVFSIEALTSSGGHVIDRDRGFSSSVVSLFTCIVAPHSRRDILSSIIRFVAPALVNPPHIPQKEALIGRWPVCGRGLDCQRERYDSVSSGGGEEASPMSSWVKGCG